MSRFLTLGAFLLLVVLTVSAQERVVGGPPPEIRDHLSSMVKAYNSGSADEWEKFAQAHYAPEALKSRTPEQRKQLFDRMHGDFGATLAISRVEREGPSAPLQVHVKGASGLEAVFQIELEEDSPYRIRSLSIQVGGPADEQAPRTPQPPVNGKMSN